jgi:murein DD-endopeptidase MepM/ murein hydrolase activator NlpD
MKTILLRKIHPVKKMQVQASGTWGLAQHGGAVLFLLFTLLCVPIFAQQTPPSVPPAPRFVLIPENPRPGEPVTIAFADGSITAAGTSGGANALSITVGSINAVLVTRDGRLSRTGFFNFPAAPGETAFKVAVLPVPSTARSGPASIRIESAGGGASALIAELPLIIAPRDFVSEEIVLDQANTDIRTAPDPQKTAESELLWAILNRTGADIYVHDAFTPPVTSTRRTSFFGDRRVFKYTDGKTDTAIHAGIDYGVPKGTAVTACADGKVVLARFRIVTGNSVIIEHLPGVYSLYYHLDKIGVSEGARVRTGDLLGQSGSTGLATGPHLHWEIRVAGENTDPDAFVSRPILDKETILSKIDISVP